MYIFLMSHYVVYYSLPVGPPWNDWVGFGLVVGVVGLWVGVVGFWVGLSVSGAIVSGSVLGGDGGLEPTRSTCSENIVNKIAVVMIFYILKQINFSRVLLHMR